MLNIGQIIDYLTENISDPVPQYILFKEIHKTNPASDEMKKSKLYRALADTQWEDGSWGRFHSRDSKAAVKFATTEIALSHARQLSLTKDDMVVSKCIKLMERYVRGEETWRDKIEKHKDDGKSHLHARPFITAAVLNLFDPDNPVIKPKRDVFIAMLKKALANGYFDEAAWENENKDYRGTGLTGWNAYPVMVLQNCDCMEESLQRQYLNYLWNRENGIYYLSDFPLSKNPCVEEKEFYAWLYTLEHMKGFSLFHEFMQNNALPHLLNEAERLINDTATIPASYKLRYSESWRVKNNRKNDLILRITRLIV